MLSSNLFLLEKHLFPRHLWDREDTQKQLSVPAALVPTSSRDPKDRKCHGTVTFQDIYFNVMRLLKKVFHSNLTERSSSLKSSLSPHKARDEFSCWLNCEKRRSFNNRVKFTPKKKKKIKYYLRKVEERSLFYYDSKEMDLAEVLMEVTR